MSNRIRRLRAPRAVASAILLSVAGSASAQVFPGNDNSYSPSISADGRFVAFYSLASNLVPGDTNGVEDVFLLDRNSDSLRRISVNAFGGQADGQSWMPVITPDARYVVFVSNASNLVAGDTNNGADVFRVDLTTGVVVRATLSNTGAQAVVGQTSISAPSISADGRFVAFAMSGSGLVAGNGVGSYVRDIDKGRIYFSATTFGFQGGKPVVASRPVAGGVEVRAAYITRPGGGATGQDDVYLSTFAVPDAQVASDPNPAITTRIVSVACAAAPCDGTTPGNGRSGAFDDTGFGLAMSADGERIAYQSLATNLVPGDSDTNNQLDLFVFRVGTRTTTRESNGLGGGFGSVRPPNLSPDGLHIVYSTGANWVVKTVGAGPTTGITNVGSGGSFGSRLEVLTRAAVANGGTVATYPSQADDVVIPRNDTRNDVFVRAGATTTIASRGRVGTATDGHTRVPAISADGRFVAFSSYASGFGGGDGGGNRDVFRRSLVDGSVVRVSSGFSALVDARFPDISGDGSRVVFMAPFGGGSCADVAGGTAFVWRAGSPTTVSCIDADANGFTNLQADFFTQPAISDDGRWAAFAGRSNFGAAELFVRDLDATSGTILTRVQPNLSTCGGDCGLAGFEDETYQLSGDGRFLVFTVRRGLLSLYDIQVWDRLNPTTPAQSISRFAGSNAQGGGKSPSISADGNWVAFISTDNLTSEVGAPAGEKVFLWNRVAVGARAAGTLSRVRGETLGRSGATRKARTRLSADGRYLVYVQDDVCVFRCASNTREIAIHDRVTGNLRTVSLTPSWGGANGPSGTVDDIGIDTFLFSLDIDGDGRKVVFGSSASNLTPGDRNAADDVFMVDVPSQTIALVSSSGSNAAGDLDRVAPVLDADGNVLAMAVKDRDGARAAGTGAAAKGAASKFSDIAINGAGQTGERVISVGPGGTPANGDSGEPAISGDGGLVVYSSSANNLSPLADPNAADDIYLWDAALGANVLVSQGNGGTVANGPSRDPDVARLAALPGAKGMVGDKWASAFTTDASNATPMPDANSSSDVVVAEQGDPGQPPTTEPVSVSSGGQMGNAPSGQPSIADGGDLVSFASLASNLAPGDGNGTTDVFMRDRNSGTTILVSAAQGGGAGNGPSSNPVGDKWGSATQPPGQSNVQWVVAFESDASNLVPDDLNGATDVFARFSNGTVRLVSRGLNGVSAAGASSAPSLSEDGRYVSFVSTAANLVNGDSNNVPDVFAYDLLTDQIRRVSVGNAGQQANDVAVSTTIGTGIDGEPVVLWDTSATNLGTQPDPDNAFDVFFRSGDDGSGAVSTTLATPTFAITSASPASTVAGQSYLVSFAASAPGGPLTGLVRITDGAGASCGPVLTNPQGAGSCTLLSQRAGAKTLTAQFVPEAAFVFRVASDIEAHNVARAGTATSLAPPAGLLLRGTQVSVTVGASVVAPGSGTPGGSITVTADTGESCTAVLPANACALVLNTTGQRTLTASYGGDADFNPSSTQLNVTVLPADELILANGFE